MLSVFRANCATRWTGVSAAKRSLSTFFVVLAPLAFDSGSGMERRGEAMLVHIFLAQPPPVEGLDVKPLLSQLRMYHAHP